MKTSTFDEICESQKFNHDQEFVLLTTDIKRKLEMHEELVEKVENFRRDWVTSGSCLDAELKDLLTRANGSL
jgi:hypothetical protein